MHMFTGLDATEACVDVGITLFALYCGARHIYRLILGGLYLAGWSGVRITPLACWVWSGRAWDVLVVVVVAVYKAGRMVVC